MALSGHVLIDPARLPRDTGPELMWAPSLRNSLRVSPEALELAEREAERARSERWDRCAQVLKNRLLRVELDGIMRDHLARAEEIRQDLDAVVAFSDGLESMQVRSPSTGGRSAPAPPSPSPAQPFTRLTGNAQYAVSISPTDPPLMVAGSLAQTLLGNLYGNINQWVPSFGPWYRTMSANAMQRRVFPKQLRGNLNFTNSVSLKLMTEVVAVLEGTTQDFFSDVRHLPDLQAALILSVAYLLLQGGSSHQQRPLPASREELLELGPESLEKIIADLKAKSPGGNFMILTSGNKEARQSIAPLNRQAAYPPGTFADNKIYNLFVGAGLLPTTAALNVPGTAGRDRDLVYRIANQIFGEDVPPFSSHQWNLRVGLAALEALMLVYTLCETANLAEAATRRLHLSSLLPQAMQRRKPAVASAGMPGAYPVQTLFRHGELFRFIWAHYVRPTVAADPQASISSLFPGLVLLALELKLMDGQAPSHYAINLTGQKFDTLFEIINQKLLFHDPAAMLAARTQLRLAFEDGVGVALGRPSPTLAAREILERQFSASDDYDRLYFLTLGYLASPVAPS